MALESADVIRLAHNSFAHPEPFEYEEVAAKEGDDVFHFISYLPFKGNVYELDGMQKGPVLIGPVEPGKDWLDVARDAIQKRMQEYTTSEIHFNLLAIVGDRKEILEYELHKDQVMKAHIGKILGYPADQPDPAPADLEKYKSDIESLPKDLKDLASLYGTLQARIHEHQLLLQYEEDKRKKWHAENQRRRHNYLPFVFEFLKLLAAKGKLPAMIEKAKEEEKKRKARKAEAKKQATAGPEGKSEEKKSA